MSSIRRRINDVKHTTTEETDNTNEILTSSSKSETKILSIKQDHDIKKERTSLLPSPPSSLKNNNILLLAAALQQNITQHLFPSNKNIYNTVANDNDYGNLVIENEKLKEHIQLLEQTLDNRKNRTNNVHKDHKLKSISSDDQIIHTNNFKEELCDRSKWLIGLLFFQSCSGFILSKNEHLLKRHPVIIYFLTMLVGAGGNAGNQSSVRVIRSLALGTLNIQSQKQFKSFLRNEIQLAILLSIILSIAGFIRAIIFNTPLHEAIAITTSLFCIVFTSITLGAVLPLFLQHVMRVDPAHSSTTIQVVMDILGVFVTVIVSTLLLDTDDFMDYFYYLF